MGVGQNVIDTGVIQIDADLTKFRDNISKLPEEMRTKARQVFAELQKEANDAQKRLEKATAIVPIGARQYARQIGRAHV